MCEMVSFNHAHAGMCAHTYGMYFSPDGEFICMNMTALDFKTILILIHIVDTHFSWNPLLADSPPCYSLSETLESVLEMVSWSFPDTCPCDDIFSATCSCFLSVVLLS